MEPNVNQEKKKVAGPGTELALLKKNITDSVMNRIQPMIEAKEIRLPSNYSVGNALTSAWFELLELKNKNDKPVLETCTKESIANALFKMSVLGLSVAKKQIAFIPYNNILTCQLKYHGNMALAKRYGGVKQINPGVVYKNDDFQYSVNTETGRKKIIKHEQELENINDDQIRGAYAVLTFEDGSEPYLEIIPIDEIKKAWMQGAAKGMSPAHKNFTGEMCKKTVISRACKLFITSSDDSALFGEGEHDIPQETRDKKIKEKSNKKVADTEDVKYEDVNNFQTDSEPEKTETSPPTDEATAELFDEVKQGPGY